MTTEDDKDPQVDRPGAPDPDPGSNASAAPSSSAPGTSDAAEDQTTTEEADEPVENRFPDDDGGDHRESG